LLSEWYLFALSFFLTLGVTKEEVASRSTGVNIDEVLDDSTGPNSTFLLVDRFKKKAIPFKAK
jgi:hypothetical protein